MKILLINPSQSMPVGIDFPFNAFQPLGLAYIANVLLKKNHQVAILDVLAEGYNNEITKGGYRYVGLPQQEVKERIKKFGPKIVGITAPFTAQAKAAHEMAQLVKGIDSSIKVVLGGSYPTTHTDIVCQDENVDFVVRSEGELTFLKLVEKIYQPLKDLNQVRGLAFRQKGRLIITPPRPFIQNLNDYKVAWELLPMEKYFQAADMVKSSRSICTYGQRWATIFTSRGCPFRCTFCVGYQVMGRTWRPRSPENVIEEMEYLIKTYQIEHFDIEDDNFTLDTQRAKKICEGIIKKGWSIKWSLPNGVRADTIDEDLVKTMAQAGCNLMVVAPESGDQWVVDKLMRKKVNLDKVKQVVKWGCQYGIIVDAFFLIGMPGEKERQVEKTIKYARELRKLGADECGFGVVVPHRGTEVYETVVKKGWLRKPAKGETLIEGLMIGEPLIDTPDLSVAKVKKLLKKAIRVNPLIPFSRIKLMWLMLIKTPRRFLRLAFSELQKRLGLKGGILGA